MISRIYLAPMAGVTDLTFRLICKEFGAEGQNAVKEEILQAMQDMFGGTDFIVGVNFSSVTSE